MKILCLADIHATYHVPSSCTDSYMDDLLDLLGQTQQVAVGFGCKAVVWAGDVFHHKAPSRTSHRLVLELIRVIGGYPCPVYIVPGNHDIQHDRVDSVIRTQPLGVLFERGARRLDGWAPWDDETGFLPIYGVPWQQHWDHESVGAVLEQYRSPADAPRAEGHTLVVTHAPLYPPGRELPYEFYPAADFASSMGDRGSCFYGHVHEPHGVYRERGVQFCNNGALSRGSLHEYNLTRDVCATIWDSGLNTFTKVTLNAKPAAEVFRLQEKQQVTDVQGRLDEFLEQIGQTTLGVVSIETVVALLEDMDLEPAVRVLAKELLTEVRA